MIYLLIFIRLFTIRSCGSSFFPVRKRHLITYFTSSTKAMIPEAIAVAADVAENVDVQVSFRSEVI